MAAPDWSPANLGLLTGRYHTRAEAEFMVDTPLVYPAWWSDPESTSVRRTDWGHVRRPTCSVRAASHENAAALAEELQQFRMRTVPMTDDVIEWRERPHDDLVLAVAVAAWQAERGPGFAVIMCEGEPEPARPRWWSPWGW
jgi:hypothetical protein